MNDSKAFFDTNLLLYSVSAEEMKAERAQALLAGGGTISVQVLNEFAAVASRKLQTPWPEIRDVLQTFRALCTIEPLSLATHEAGLRIAERYGFHIYDSMIVSAAMQAGCAVLWSEDMQHRQAIDGLVIRNPFAAN